MAKKLIFKFVNYTKYKKFIINQFKIEKKR